MRGITIHNIYNNRVKGKNHKTDMILKACAQINSKIFDFHRIILNIRIILGDYEGPLLFEEL